jgi:Prp8 binding protein
MDSTLYKWDVRPFAAGNDRCMLSYAGVHHGAEKSLLKCSWSPDSEHVTCGSADRIVHIWDSTSGLFLFLFFVIFKLKIFLPHLSPIPHTGKQLYYLPGHKGSVNEVIYHQKEPIIVSCGSDKNIYIGELLQADN